MKLRWYQEEAVDKLLAFFSVPRQLDESGKPKRKAAVVCLPTGTGKSVVIAVFLLRAFGLFAGTRALMLTHVSTLVLQNALKLLKVWNLAPLGVYASGLKRKETANPIIFGSIQSVIKALAKFGFFDFLIIDEAHLVGDDGMYLRVIEWLLEANPYLKIIMLTATPYRLGMGLLTNGPIATDIVYNLCTLEGFNRLVAEGYLCRLVPKRTNTQLEIKGVSISGQDFNQKQLQAAVDKYETTLAALKETVTIGNDPNDYRHCWLIFASGVEHAEHICDMLNDFFGVSTVVLHSDKSDVENDEAYQAWISGKVRAAVSMNKLTTGVDHPPVDFIPMLRPSASTGLWVQMLGRGTRPYDFRDPGEVDPVAFPYVKRDCMVLDFAGNTRRLGPINDPIIPRQKGEGPPGDAPVRICVVCNNYNHASAKVCEFCGTPFPANEKLARVAGSDELLKGDMPIYEMIAVDRRVIVPHTTLKGLSAIKIAYYCGMRTYYEQKSVETKSGFYRHKSREWFRQHYHYQTPVAHVAQVDFKDETWDDVPNNNADVLKLAPQLRTPKRIRVWINANPTPEVMGYEF
jgi:DNA repair protein RadD